MPASPAQPLYDHQRPPRPAAPDWGGDDLFDAVPRRRFARGPAEGPAVAPEREPAPDRPATLRLAPEPVLELTPALEPAASRRTVTVTGHPGRSAVPVRHRPSTLEQRIHARPDRMAAWAFALCVFLIVVALATSF